MPYIITVNQPGCLPEADPYAVATIEDAREGAMNELRRGTHHGAIDHAPTAATLPETGGVIGPLPDGYVIDVQRVSWNWIIGKAEDAGIDTEMVYADGGDLAILDAYNGA